MLSSHPQKVKLVAPGQVATRQDVYDTDLEGLLAESVKPQEPQEDWKGPGALLWPACLCESHWSVGAGAGLSHSRRLQQKTSRESRHLSSFRQILEVVLWQGHRKRASAFFSPSTASTV